MHHCGVLFTLDAERLSTARTARIISFVCLYGETADELTLAT